MFKKTIKSSVAKHQYKLGQAEKSEKLIQLATTTHNKTTYEQQNLYQELLIEKIKKYR